MKYGTTLNWHHGRTPATAAGCSQRVSLPVVFRPNRCFTLSLIVEGEINPSPPNSFLGIKVATGLPVLPPGTGKIL